MDCSSCGTLLEPGTEKCKECDAQFAIDAVGVAEVGSTHEPSSVILGTQRDNAAQIALQPSKLIEFPGVSRTAIPQWRKDLSERVREVQEKRAREDALEGNGDRRLQEHEPLQTPQLELLPQAEVAPLNPLVAAALRRIERAHEPNATYARSAERPGGVAVAYATKPEFRDSDLSAFEMACTEFPGEAEYRPPVDAPDSSQPEKVHNLVVVPPRVLKTEEPQTRPQPRRMIGDLNDPALNYLDSILTTVHVEATTHRQAPTLSRLLSAVVDLIVVAVLFAPVAAVLELANTNWHDYKVAIFVGAAFAVISFLYFTVSTGLTGRTLGLRLFSLRVVDARTGLIPTGSQSAGRALIYVLTLLTLGVGSLYALLNPERQTAHDRLTRTAVILV